MAKAAIVTRLETAAANLDRARKQLADALERRNRLVLQAIDEGVSIRTVAAAADLSHPGVVKVCATPHAWLSELSGG